MHVRFSLFLALKLSHLSSRKVNFQRTNPTEVQDNYELQKDGVKQLAGDVPFFHRL